MSIESGEMVQINTLWWTQINSRSTIRSNLLLLLPFPPRFFTCAVSGRKPIVVIIVVARKWRLGIFFSDGTLFGIFYEIGASGVWLFRRVKWKYGGCQTSVEQKNKQWKLLIWLKVLDRCLCWWMVLGSVWSIYFGITSLAGNTVPCIAEGAF